MQIGFTGTRNKMSHEQFGELWDAIQTLRDTVGVEMAHHGDCVGADATFHEICVELKIPITIHPPIETNLRAWKEGKVLLEARTYLARNRTIVEASDQMFGVPYTTEETKGGTWYTINYAKKCKVPVQIILPN
jgi:hypothetical protein